ncbi:MAG: Maf family protein [Gammaproteobacteria bacterium]
MADLFDIYLASASPRRRELLEQIGVQYRLLSVDVDETPLESESPAEYVSRLALEKACSGWQLVESTDKKPVLGADTAVVVNGEILGKPDNKVQAIKMLMKLSSQTHQVLSGIALVTEKQQKVSVNTSLVTFRGLSEAECEAYWHTGEPADKAGSYAIQGRAAMFISKLSGSYSGVMGLPLYETAELLQNTGGR